MALRWLRRSPFTSRRAIRALELIAARLDQQVGLLARIADAIAPLPPVTERGQVAELSGVDYMDPTDQAIILQYVARTEADTGRPPSDEEILAYLVDEKTRDLHQRLIDRDAQIARLAQEFR